MRCFARIVGWALLTIAAVLVLLGIISWPPGGLMFALPYFFLIPGIFFALIGAGLIFLGYRNSGDSIRLKNPTRYKNNV